MQNGILNKISKSEFSRLRKKYNKKKDTSFGRNNMNSMLSKCENLKTFQGISKQKTKIKGINHLFYKCNPAKSSPDVSERDISQVKGKNKANAERRPQFIILAGPPYLDEMVFLKKFVIN